MLWLWELRDVGIIGIAVVGMLVFLLMWGARADGYEAEGDVASGASGEA